MKGIYAAPRLQLLNIAVFLLMVLVNYLANSIPLGGNTTGEISEHYSNLFVPAGYTFAIWGVIYLLLAAFVVFQAKDIHKLNKDPLINTIGPLFVISSLANIAWVFAWHYHLIALSLIFMLVLLVSLVLIYLKLGIGVNKVTRPVRYLVHLPFSIYLGWISIATIANINAFLVSVSLMPTGFLEVIWTIILIIFAVLLSLWVLHKRGDIFYSSVAAWALIGVFVKRANADEIIWVLVFVLVAAASVVIYFIVLETMAKLGIKSRHNI